MEYWIGLLCAASAAIAFGVQYAPVKKYEIYDGITFQWFMCAGILMVGFLSSIIFGDFGMKDNECLLIIFGGGLWALSNYLVLPLVKLLGIGLGFSLYHFVNLMVGYVVGRFGLFQMERLQGNLLVCDLGCALILISFVVMVFVEGEEKGTSRGQNLELPPPIFPIDNHYREMYQRWRQGEARGARDLPQSFVMETAIAVRSAMFGHAAMEPNSNLKSVGGFGLLGTRSEVVPLRPTEDYPVSNGAAATPSILRRNSEPNLALPLSLHNSDGQGIDLSSGSAVKFLGIALALFAGGLAGVQSVPATLYNQRHPEASATVVIFPQCLGIYICSSFIYLFYAAVARASGWSIPHSAIRPPYFSGCIWAVGFSFMIVGISVLGFSIGYTLDAVGPIVVASMLSIFVFKEIRKPRQLMLYWGSFTLQFAGVLLMTFFSEHK